MGICGVVLRKPQEGSRTERGLKRRRKVFSGVTAEPSAPPFTPPHRVLALEMVYVIRILFFLSSEEKPFGGSEALHHQELLCLCFSGPVSPRPGPVSSLPDVPEQRPAVLGGRNRSMQCTSGY